MSPRTDIDEHISHMTTGKLLVKPLVVLLTAFAAYLLTKQMLSPLKSIASLAQGLTLKTPYIHLNASDSADEYDELIRILNESYSRLQDASVRISNFTSEASHELRSPIAAIRVTAENAIRQDADEFMLRQAMHEIHSESIHMTELVSQLLALSRLESSERNSLCETVRVDYILESLSDRYTCLASESFVGFSMNSVVPFEVRGDRVHLRQMFTNLIDNAFKFTPAGGAISVTSRVDGAVWRLRIVDTGIGISKEHMPRVFDRFFRANPFGKQGNNGSGLGLPLCRAIAKIHGGDITAESEVGTGSVFEVSLPRTPPVDDDERFYLDESHTRIAETEETHLTFERSPSDS
jgi:signal transduction histidine kinase